MNKVCFDCDDPVFRVWIDGEIYYQSSRTGEQICNLTNQPHRAMYEVRGHAPRRSPSTSGSRKSGGLIDAIGDIFDGIFDFFT